MAKAALFVKVEGITGYDPLFIPLERETDFQGGWTATRADKVGNDPNTDISTNLITLPVITSLAGGCWARDWKLGDNKYFDSLPSDATNGGPLLWTLTPEIAIAPPCMDNDKSGAYGFKEITVFNSIVYAIDLVANKVYYDNSGTWTDATATLGAAPTEIFAGDPQAQKMYIGVTNTASSGTPYARTKDTTSATSTWANFSDPLNNDSTGTPAEHFVAYGKALFYSYNRNVVREYNGSRQTRVGYNGTSINRLVWYNDVIIVLKPEGAFSYDPVTGVVKQFFYSGSMDTLNGRVGLVHNQKVWFNMNFGWYSYDGGTVQDQTFLKLEGTNTQLFDFARIVGGYSDGKKIWLVAKVTTSDSTVKYKYYLVGYNGVGHHPVLVKISTTDATSQIGGVFFNNNQLYYSMGYKNGTSKNQTGYLSTDGDQPLSPSAPYPSGASLVTGYVDFERAYNSKHVKQVIAEWGNLSAAYPQIVITYQKANQSSWQTLGTITTTTGGGTSTLTVPAESGAQAGFVTNKARFQVQMQTGTIATSGSYPGTVAEDATIGITSWTNINNVKTSNDTYATTGTMPNFGASMKYIKATNFGFSIPTGATINGVVVSIEGYATSSPSASVVRYGSVSLVKGGTITGNDYVGAGSLGTVEEVSTFGSSSDLWGLTLTASDINASNFGCVFNITKITDGSTANAFIDSVSITVYYTAPNPWHLKNMHAVGYIHNDPAYEATMRALLDTEEGTEDPLGRTVTYARVYGGLTAALTQAAPVKITHPATSNGTTAVTYFGRFKPISRGDHIVEVDTDSGKVMQRYIDVAFVEDK